MSESTFDLALQSGAGMLGQFGPPGVEDVDLGVLQWTPEHGVELKLFGEIGWPGEVGGPIGPVHGRIDADELTLLGGWTARRGIGTTHAFTIRGSTLLRGGHYDSESEWSKILVKTANLHEWIPDTGITSDHSMDADGKMEAFRVEWRRPQGWTVELSDARLTISPSMATEWEYSPGHSIRTDYEFMVEAAAPASLEVLHRRFTQPLLFLTVLASDLPDALTLEHVAIADPRRAARVFRQGPRVLSRSWNPSQPFLFYAVDLPDMTAAFQRWFVLFERIPEALGNFADSVNEGNSYSPDRLLKVTAAAEAYHREFHHRGGRLEQRLAKLRDFAGFSDDGPFSDRNLALIAAGRNHHSHSGAPGHGFSVEEIADSGFSSIRRATALMQGCLMRELGFDVEKVRSRVTEHYASWPIP